MKILRILTALVVVTGFWTLSIACPGKGTHDAAAPDIRPGQVYDVSTAISTALNCPVADITWSVVEPDCGSVAGGLFSAPACGSACLPALVHVRGRGCGKAAEVGVEVAEEVLSVSVCGVAGQYVPGTPGVCCARTVVLGPGATATFFATVTYSCPGHVEFSPSAPPPACP